MRKTSCAVLTHCLSQAAKLRVPALLLCVPALLLCVLLAGAASAQQPAPAGPIVPATQKKTCSILNEEPSPGLEALAHRRYEEADKLYAAMPPSSEATAGLIRALIGERRVPDALAMAEKANQEHPNDALLMDALGAVRYRRGDIDDAATMYLNAIKVDPCPPMLHYDFSRYMRFYGLYKSAQKQLDLAHQLAPRNPLILRAWEPTQRVPPTTAQTLDKLERRKENPKLDEEEKQGIEASIKAIQSRQKGDCELVSAGQNGRIPLQSLGNATNAQESYGAGVDVILNGHRKRLELDTGASGLLLTREAASSLGLVQEVESRSGGLGDEGSQSEFVSHVDDVKMGNMEFHNCQIRVFEGKNVLRADGLIGTDVFRKFLVTLDLPGLEIRIAPLPPRPGDVATASTASLGTEGDDDPGEGQGTPLTPAQAATDRYVSPEMKDWTRVFRYGHLLIFKTSIGKSSTKLFAMDTGASTNLISPLAAREVTRVSKDSDTEIKGISGKVKDVSATGDIAIQFAGIRQISYSMTAIDTSGITSGSGVELSGFIGYPTLKELNITIDYRDNLVHITYSPHIGTTGR